MVGRRWRALLLCGAVTVACGDGAADDDDEIVLFDAGSVDAAVDAAPPGDDNDSFDEAVPVDVGDPASPGSIGLPGDQDFFVFEGEAGQWLEIAALPDDFSTELFPIVTLFDAAHQQVAEGFILATRLEAAGTYYVKVEDFTSLLGLPMPFFDPDATYGFTVREPVDGVDDYFFDAELGDDAGSAVAVPVSGVAFADLLGLYDHAGDRDVYSLSLSGSGTKVLSAYMAPPGPTGNGSTSDYSALWVTDETGTEVLARIGTTAFMLRPPLPSPGTYLLWVEKSAAAPSSNDFYDVSVVAGFDDDPSEQETLEAPGTNDTIALADSNDEVIPLGADTTYFISYLPEGDVDYVGFDASGAVTIEATCVASNLGSGLIGMNAEIRDSTDGTLVSGTEPGFVFLDTVLPAAGRYYFRLSAAGQSTEVTGNWVRCWIEIPSF